jgi:hypothetical protein
MTKSITEVNLNVDMLEVKALTDRVDELRELLESSYAAGSNRADADVSETDLTTFDSFDEAQEYVISIINERKEVAETEDMAAGLAILAERVRLETEPFSIILAGRCYWVTCEGDFEEERKELHFLEQTLREMQGYGGNYQWEGDWYPDYLIADQHFKTYAKELAYDVSGEELRNARWPMNCIDWEKATQELMQDYTSITIDGHEFLYVA